jgi:hypothetical protein
MLFKKKALVTILSKNLNLFYKNNNSPNLGFNSSFQKRWFQGLDLIPIFSNFVNLSRLDTSKP